MESIVIDQGSFFFKSGFGGDDAPRTVDPPIVVTRKTQSNDTQNEYFGFEAHQRRQTSQQSPIISKGSIFDFNFYEKFLNYIFVQLLKIDIEERPLLLTERTGTEPSQREKVTEILFERFNSPAFYTMNDNLASLYGTGRVTGTVLNIGHEQTCCTPIYDGEVLPYSPTFGPISGKEITEFLKKDFKFDDHVVTNLKEKCCEVVDYQKMNDILEPKTFQLPDGKSIKVDQGNIMAPEVLFKPSMMNIEGMSIQETILASVENIPSFIENDLYHKVILCGGTSLIKGLTERLSHEVGIRYSKPLKIIAPPERKYSTWIGGSIFSSLSVFPRIYMSKGDYDEFGAKHIEFKSPSSFSKYEHQKRLKRHFNFILKRSSQSGDIRIHYE